MYRWRRCILACGWRCGFLAVPWALILTHYCWRWRLVYVERWMLAYRRRGFWRWNCVHGLHASAFLLVFVLTRRHCMYRLVVCDIKTIVCVCFLFFFPARFFVFGTAWVLHYNTCRRTESGRFFVHVLLCFWGWMTPVLNTRGIYYGSRSYGWVHIHLSFCAVLSSFSFFWYEVFVVCCFAGMFRTYRGWVFRVSHVSKFVLTGSRIGIR